MSSGGLRLAIAAVREAAELTRRLQEGRVQTLSKSDLSPVTLADVAAQVLVSYRLHPTGLPIVGEEGAESARPLMEPLLELLKPKLPDLDQEMVLRLLARPSDPGGHFWTLDPIDGTKGFLRNQNFAIALALVGRGQVELGVLGCPRLELSCLEAEGLVAAAERGGGSWVSPVGDSDCWMPVKCSPQADPGRARLLSSVEAAHTDHDRTDALLEKLGSQEPRVGIDSQAKYVKLAAGEAEVLLRLPNPKQPDYREKIWDHAAGQIILEEAGGQVTDIGGKALDFSRGACLTDNVGILATNGRIHQAVLEAL